MRIQLSKKNGGPDMLIDKMIENKREALYHAIDSKGMTHKKTIRVSQELDKLITKKMEINYR
jgi:hypothetical protein